MFKLFTSQISGRFNHLQLLHCREKRSTSIYTVYTASVQKDYPTTPKVLIVYNFYQFALKFIVFANN